MPGRGLSTNAVVGATLAWLAAAAALGAAGVFEPLRPPAPQAILIALTVLTLLATAVVAPVRRWTATVDPRVLVVLHVTRVLAGGYFLVLYRRGELPYAFAVPGGIGDIVVATLAIVVCVATRPDQGRGRGPAQRALVTGFSGRCGSSGCRGSRGTGRALRCRTSSR